MISVQSQLKRWKVPKSVIHDAKIEAGVSPEEHLQRVVEEYITLSNTDTAKYVSLCDTFNVEVTKPSIDEHALVICGAAGDIMDATTTKKTTKKKVYQVAITFSMGNDKKRFKSVVQAVKVFKERGYIADHMQQGIEQCKTIVNEIASAGVMVAQEYMSIIKGDAIICIDADESVDGGNHNDNDDENHNDDNDDDDNHNDDDDDDNGDDEGDDDDDDDDDDNDKQIVVSLPGTKVKPVASGTKVMTGERDITTMYKADSFALPYVKKFEEVVNAPDYMSSASGFFALVCAPEFSYASNAARNKLGQVFWPVIAMGSALGEVISEVPDLRANLRAAVFAPNRIKVILEKLKHLKKWCDKMRDIGNTDNVPVEIICKALAPSVHSVFLHTRELAAIRMGDMMVNSDNKSIVKVCYNDNGIPDDDVDMDDSDSDSDVSDNENDTDVTLDEDGLSARESERLLKAIGTRNQALLNMVIRHNTASSIDEMLKSILRECKGDAKMVSEVKRVRAELELA